MAKDYKLILKLENGIQIKADLNNWILFAPPRSYWYHSSLHELFENLLDIEIKFYAFQDQRKTIEGLRDSIQKAEEEISQIIKDLTALKTSARKRLMNHERRLNEKDD